MNRAAATPSPGDTVGEPRCGHHSIPTPSKTQYVVFQPPTTSVYPLHTFTASPPITRSCSTLTVCKATIVDEKSSQVNMLCSSSSRSRRRMRDAQLSAASVSDRHHRAAEPEEAVLRSDTVRRRGRKSGRMGGRRRRRDPPPPLNSAPPNPTQTTPHDHWDIHKVGLANKNRTTVETSKYSIPTGKRLIFKKLFQTHGKRHNEKVKPTRVIKFTPIKKVLQP